MGDAAHLNSNLHYNAPPIRIAGLRNFAMYYSSHKHFLPDKHLPNCFLNAVPRFEPFRF